MIGAGARARTRLIEIGLPALLAYVPLVLTEPGQVGADTKTYLYVDPDRLLSSALSMWQPDTGLGTVTHQNIGYVWPMGPWFWLFEHLGSPDWLAQRLWLGTVLLVAALGVRFLLRTLGWSGAGVVVASLAYMLSPYVLDYSARISVLLLPWAGLPWLIALTDRAVRSGGWRHPAAFGLVVATIGSINATSILLVGLAAPLWLLHVSLIDGSARPATALRAAVRIGVATVVTSVWWIAGLALQAGYSLPVTEYTEAYEVIADTATSTEVMRSLGYWFFYGSDKLGPWIHPSVQYTEIVPLLAVSLLVPLLALAAAAFVRWRHRPYFLVLFVVAALIAIGAHPLDDPSVLGGMFHDWTRTDAGLAMRSTPRALPMLVLATAVFLGAGVEAVARMRPRWERPVAIGVGLLVVVNLPPLWTLAMVEEHLKRDEDLPAYWLEAIDHLEAQGDDSRVLALPGADFSSHRWGNTVDPIAPGLMDRPYVGRELVPQGSGPSAALVVALDQGLQEGTFDLESLVPVARLMSVGDILYQADLKFERYRTPRPRPTWDLLRRAPGLGAPIEFGTDVAPNVAGPEQPLVDEIAVAVPASLAYPPGVAVFPVPDPAPLVHQVPVEGGVLLVGDADGLVAAAAEGLVDPDRALVFAATLYDAPDDITAALDEASSIVITDTNRRQARNWGTVRDVTGFTETEGYEAEEFDPSDHRLPVFAEDLPDDHRTVAVHVGGAEVSATDYGNPVSYTPSDRAVLAVDGDPRTAWRVGAFDDPRGARLRIDLDDPTELSSVELLQPVTGPINRVVTEVRVHFDDGSHVDATLDDRSRTVPGQIVEFPERVVSSVEIEVVDTNVAPRPVYFGVSGVGFAEVGLGDLEVTELIRTPTAVVEDLGAAEGRDVHVVLTRVRVDPREPLRNDPERAIRRLVTVPGPRDYELAGAARLSPRAPSELIDELVGRVATPEGVALVANATTALPGDLASRASAAFDGDPDTAWRTGFEAGAGAEIEVRRGEPTTVAGVDLVVGHGLEDSVPTRVTVLVDGVEVHAEDLPELASTDERFSTTPVRLDFGPVEGSAVTVRIDEVRRLTTKDWYSGGPTAFPVRLAEIGIDGFVFGPAADVVDTGCRDDLLTLDGAPLAVRISGAAPEGFERPVLDVEACEPLELDGLVELVADEGEDTGLDLDRLVLSSLQARPATPPVTSSPEVLESGRTALTVELPPSDQSTWLVLNQSHNLGWEARAQDLGDLGEPVLVQGYANGWLVPPHEGTSTIELEWTPQRLVWWSVWFSVGAVIVALVAMWRGRPAPAPAPARIEFLAPSARTRARPGPVALGVAAVGLVVFGALNLPDGLPALILVVVALVVPLWARRRLAVPALAGWGCLALAVLYVVVQQARHGYPADFTWPMQFDRVHWLGVLALVFLAAEVVRSALVGDDRIGGDPPTPTRPESSGPDTGVDPDDRSASDPGPSVH